MSASKRDHLAKFLSTTGVLRVLEWLARRPGLVVFNYHRIGALEGNPFDDGVFSGTAADFRFQVRYLRDHFELPGLEDLMKIQETGFTIRRPMALITFDDGYRDNFDLAFPILREAGVPAAFFIPTSYIQNPRLPWWDHIAYVVKNTREQRFTLEYPSRLTIDLHQSSRSQAILDILKIYKQATDVKENDFLQHLQERASVDLDSQRLGQELFMSWDQIRRLNANGMTIGSHTHSHQILSALTESEQRRELSISKQILEDELRRPVRTIAYPVGGQSAFSDVTKRLAQQAGYRIGFSYYGGVNRNGHADSLDVRRTTVESRESFHLFRARATLHTLVGRSI